MSTRAQPAALTVLLPAVLLGGCFLNFSEYAVGNTASSSGTTLPTAAWSERLGGTSYDSAGRPGIDIGPKGDVFITGVFSKKIVLGTGTLSSLNLGVFVAKLDASTGKPLWSKAIADTKSEVGALAATPDDGVVVAGSFDVAATLNGMNVVPATGGTHDIFLARYDTDGNSLWGRTFGATPAQYAKAVAVDPMGMIYVTGQFQGGLDFGSPTCPKLDAMSAEGDGFLAQFDGNGTCLWAQQFGAHARGQSLSADGAGVILGGEYTGPMKLGNKTFSAGTDTAFIARFGADGAVRFADPIAGASDIQVASNPLTGGAIYGASLLLVGADHVIVGERDDKGTPLWSREYIGDMSLHMQSITRTPSGNLFISGWAKGSLDFGVPVAQNHGTEDMLLARLSPKGDPLGAAEFGDALTQYGINVRADALGNVYLYGSYKGVIDFGNGPLMSTGDFDVALAKFAITGPP